MCMQVAVRARQRANEFLRRRFGTPAAALIRRIAHSRRCYIDRAMTIFMTSFDPPKIRVIRLSRYMRAIG